MVSNGKMSQGVQNLKRRMTYVPFEVAKIKGTKEVLDRKSIFALNWASRLWLKKIVSSMFKRVISRKKIAPCCKEGNIEISEIISIPS